jgi:hypothetical protein
VVLNNISVGRHAEATGGDAKKLTGLLVEALDVLVRHFEIEPPRRAA